MLDEAVVKWIQEFLLRSRNKYSEFALESLQSLFPIDDDKPHLKKMSFLRKIELEISSNEPVSETILDSLESISEIDNKNGKSASRAMKAAYCAVAVACTVPFVENDDYIEIVMRVWWGRVRRMEKKVEGCGLGSDELSGKKIEVEQAAWDDSVCERLTKVDVVAEAVGKVRVYLEEAWADTRPSMLDASAKGYIGFGGLGFEGADHDVEDGFVRGGSSGKNAGGADTNAVGGDGDDVIILSDVRADTNAVGESSGGQRELCETPVGQRNVGEVVSGWSNLLRRSLGPTSSRTYAPRPNDNNASDVDPNEKFVFRRRRKKWTPLEEDTLVKGIKKFGLGNWKLINLAYHDVFGDRTDVDLKDKWRNMNRYGRMKM